MNEWKKNYSLGQFGFPIHFSHIHLSSPCDYCIFNNFFLFLCMVHFYTIFSQNATTGLFIFKLQRKYIKYVETMDRRALL